MNINGAGSTAIASNHSGSTNRGAFLVRPKTHPHRCEPGRPQKVLMNRALCTPCKRLLMVRSVDIAFNQALVTFRMISNTKSVTSQPSPVNATKPLYENRAGFATVTIDDGGDSHQRGIRTRRGICPLRYGSGGSGLRFANQPHLSGRTQLLRFVHILPIAAIRWTAFKGKHRNYLTFDDAR